MIISDFSVKNHEQSNLRVAIIKLQITSDITILHLQWFARKYLFFKGACKFRDSRKMFLKAK